MIYPQITQMDADFFKDDPMMNKESRKTGKEFVSIFVLPAFLLSLFKIPSAKIREICGSKSL